MIVLILGQIGTGKTFFNDVLVREFSRRHPEHDVIAVRPEGFARTMLPGRARTFLYGPEALDYLWAEHRVNFFASFSEVHEVAGRRAGAFDPRMHRLVFRGRHIGCNLICDSQRAAEVDPRLYSQASDTFSFRQELPLDLDRAEEYAIHPGARDIIRALPDRAYYSFRSGAVHTLRV